jgi:hypothetical protein
VQLLWHNKLQIAEYSDLIPFCKELTSYEVAPDHVLEVDKLMIVSI